MIAKTIDASTTSEAIQLAGCDWFVNKRRIKFIDEDESAIDIDDYRALVREDKKSVLDIVTDRYNPLQNKNAFDFFDVFLHEGDAKIETAGTLKGGKIIWILAKIKGNPREVIDGDAIAPYLLLSNTHGGRAILICFTFIRVICENTLRNALENARTGGNLVSITHSSQMIKKLDEVRASINLTMRSFDSDMESFTKFAKKSLTLGATKDYVKDVLRIDADEKERTFDKVMEQIANSPGIEIPGVEGTLWGAYNGITYWIDHVRGRNEDNRRYNSWFGNGVALRNRAHDLALAIVN